MSADLAHNISIGINLFGVVVNAHHGEYLFAVLCGVFALTSFGLRQWSRSH